MPANPASGLPANVALLEEKSNLVSQTNQGPSLSEVAAQVLRSALKQQYPTLAIDPDSTLIVTPQWRRMGEALEPLAPQLESLTQALMRQGRSRGSANFIEGEHFLTPAPLTQAPLHLAVSIEDIAKMLNDHAPVLFDEFKQQQLDFWNESFDGLPRWQGLSHSLKTALNVKQAKGWDADQCQVARAVSMHPDKAARALENTETPVIQACLIDIDYNEPGNTGHLLLGGAIVLNATLKQRKVIMLYTIAQGYESFDSLATLGASLPARLEKDLTGHTLSWRLFEPEGDIFDYMAWALISVQIESIGALAPSSTALPNRVLHSVERATIHFSAEEEKHVEQLEAAIPPWLARASATDQQAYGYYLSNQGQLRDASSVNDIPLISQYAQDAMRNAIIADREQNHGNDAQSLALDDLQITVTNSITIGPFILPNVREQQVETLAEFALQNTPPYMAEVKFKNDLPVPAWLTVDYLLQKAEQVDIGTQYPQLLKTNLMDDAAKAALQKQRYVSLLPDLLRLTALECKLRKHCGVDETGYRYICELMDNAQGKSSLNKGTVVIRPLTFVPRLRLRSGADTVTNMFIIGPSQQHIGPCLLYRPLLEKPLLQFSSVQNMIYAMHQPGELRESILAWLPTPALSFEYSQYVFPVGLPSPWLAVQSAYETLSNVDLAGPIALGNDALSGDVLGTLFTHNASALIEKADRQSLSNGERRWALLKESAWAIFDVASTFLTGPVGTAVWVWQVIGELQQGLDAYERNDSLVEWTSLGDVLMALGMVLIHRASLKRKELDSTRFGDTHPEPLTARRAPVTLPAPEPAAATLTLDPVVLKGELPAYHATALELGVSVPRRTTAALGVYLDSVEVSAPELTHEALETLTKIPPHLYRLDGKQYAQAGTRWFEVTVDEDEQVLIVDHRHPARSGPMLTHDQQGKWYVDTRLRLRGGGPKKRIQAMRQAKDARRTVLEAQLNAFRTQEAGMQAEQIRLRNALYAASDALHGETARVYTEHLDALIQSHTQILDALKEWRALGGEARYADDLLHLTASLEQYLTLWLTIKKNQYAQAIKPFIDRARISHAAPVSDDHVAITQTIDLGNTIIQRLTLANTTLSGLDVLGKVGRTNAHAIKKLLPQYIAEDLKANEIGISYGLCIQEQPTPDMTQAREAVGRVLGDASLASHEVADLIRQPPVTESLDERVATLTRLVDIYADVRQRLQDLPGQHAGKVRQAAIDRLLGLTGEFQKIVQDRLEALLPDEPIFVPSDKPAPATAGPSWARPKVSRPRPKAPEAQTSPALDEETVAKVIPQNERPSRPVLDDIDVIGEGMDLDMEVEDFITRTSRDALRPNRIPADVQDLFDQKALKLEEAATQVETAMTNLRVAGKTVPPVARLGFSLREGAVRLRANGINTRTALLKKRKPRQAYFQWLHENAQISIVRNVKGRIKTRERQDYFQEYQITDAEGKDLWIAHFHYDTLDSPAEKPTAAHLKVSDKYVETLTPELRQQLETLQPIDYALRRISNPSTQTLFLSLEPKQ